MNRPFAVRRSLLLLVLLAAAPLLLPGGAGAAGKSKSKSKGKEPPPPPVGEVKSGDWTCYAPPDFAAMTESQRRSERSKAWSYLEKLAAGQLREGFKIIDSEDLTYFETAFLGRPALLDGWLADNYKHCQAAAAGKESQDAYLSWFSKQGKELEAGECYRPLAYEYHNFMDIQAEWQFRLHACKDDQVLIEATGEENGKYTVTDTGDFKKNKYITASGDPDLPQAGDAGVVPDMPLGALVMRFESEDGSYTRFYAVGHKLEWQAPDHGFISFQLNDTTYFDNKFHDLKGAIDYLGIDVYPAEKGEQTSQEGLP
jgi:hypothetical protein